MSLCISEMGGTEGRAGEPGVQGPLYLNIGLHNGVLLRTVVDQVTGDLSDTRTRYIGSRPVKLFRVTMQGGEAVLAMRRDVEQNIVSPISGVQVIWSPPTYNRIDFQSATTNLRTSNIYFPASLGRRYMSCS